MTEPNAGPTSFPDERGQFQYMSTHERDAADAFCRWWSGITFLDAMKDDRCLAVSAWLLATCEDERDRDHWQRHESMRQESYLHHGIEDAAAHANGATVHRLIPSDEPTATEVDNATEEN